MQNTKTKKIILTAMICAMAYILVFFLRIPAVSFLKYEPKDIIIALGGFILGPMAAVISSVTVSLIEMLTISQDGILGCIMNVLATCSFACTAALVYNKRKTSTGAALGLFLGVVSMTIIMIAWNYLITPLYLGVSRAEVAPMLLTVFLPFNLIKGGINASIVLLIYNPVISALRKAHLINSTTPSHRSGKNIWLFIAGGVVLITGILLILVFNGTIK